MVVKIVVRPIAKLSEGLSTILDSNKAADAMPRHVFKAHLRRDQLRGRGLDRSRLSEGSRRPAQIGVRITAAPEGGETPA
jgi:hypothetical protein